jgi:hypothetical protein
VATRLFAVIALVALMVGATGAQDARGVLQAVAKNIGADTVKTIQITGTGWNAAPGQSYSPTSDWPKFDITSYTKVIDYDARSSREQITRRQGSYPISGWTFWSAATPRGTCRARCPSRSCAGISTGFPLPTSASWTSS